MDYTSTLETLESFWIAISRFSAHQIRAFVILYPLVKVSSTGIPHGSQQGALFTLSKLLNIPYGRITRVLQRPFNDSGMFYPGVPNTDLDLGQSSTRWVRLEFPGNSSW